MTELVVLNPGHLDLEAKGLTMTLCPPPPQPTEPARAYSPVCLTLRGGLNHCYSPGYHFVAAFWLFLDYRWRAGSCLSQSACFMSAPSQKSNVLIYHVVSALLLLFLIYRWETEILMGEVPCSTLVEVVLAFEPTSVCTGSVFLPLHKASYLPSHWFIP